MLRLSVALQVRQCRRQGCPVTGSCCATICPLKGSHVGWGWAQRLALKAAGCSRVAAAAAAVAVCPTAVQHELRALLWSPWHQWAAAAAAALTSVQLKAKLTLNQDLQASRMVTPGPPGGWVLALTPAGHSTAQHHNRMQLGVRQAVGDIQDCQAGPR